MPMSVMVTEEGVFTSDDVADAAEDSAPKGRTAKPAANRAG